MKAKHQSESTGSMSAADVSAFVRQNDDFAFEMQVAGEIRFALGVDVTHGASYVDPVSLKPRQFDVRFRIQDERKTVYFAVECKNVSPVSPVIVCGRRAEAKENFHDIVVSRGQGSTLSAHADNAGSTYFHSGAFVGKSILKPGRGKDGEIYEGWSQALSSAHELVEEAVQKGASFDTQTFGAVFPWLVVPNNALWSVEFDQTGKMSEPQQAKYCRYFVGHRIDDILHCRGPVRLSHVEIMTLDGMRELLNRLRDIRHDWDDWIPSKVRNSYKNGG